MLKYSRQRLFTDSFSLAAEAKFAADPEFLSSRLLIVGVSGDEKIQKTSLAELPFLADAFAQAQKLYAFKGKYAESALIAGEGAVLFVGLGALKDLTPQKLLNLGGKIWLGLKNTKNLDAVFLGDTFLSNHKLVTATQFPCDFAGRPLLERALLKEEILERLLCGFFLASYKIPKPLQEKKDEKKEKAPPLNIAVFSKVLPKDKLAKVLQEVVNKCQAMTWARDETHLPANVLTPAVFAAELQKLGEESGFKTKIFDEKYLQKEGFQGIWSVGKGSENPPRLVQMEYNATKSGVPHLVLVGKGVTFDTGGISIKPAALMEEMKHDMTGAAIAAAALSYLAKSKSPLRVTVLAALAENRPSHNAILPGDVYEAWGGKTVEVQNTDAEGRLLLGDCLAYAQTLKPSVVIDLATLTGAAFTTLGPAGFLLYGNEAPFTEAFFESTKIAGEQCWEMPLFEEYAIDLKSTVADMRNISGHRDGMSHVAACFLQNFVEDAYPWMHLDICAYTLSTKWKGAHCPPEANCALPTLALAQFANDLAKKKINAKKRK